MKRKKKSPVAARILQGLQEFSDALATGEDLSRRFRVRTLALDLAPRSYSAEQVQKTRKLLGASQVTFALLLGVANKTIRSWEAGTSTPGPMASRFMDEIQRNPGYWVARLKESLVIA